tara:strand:- start:286 stop:441 length:156 start_codon:yes stop_codon:yes gene_type:complete
LFVSPTRDFHGTSVEARARHDLAVGTVFLASRSSDYVSGAILNVDGGWLGR